MRICNRTPAGNYLARVGLKTFWKFVFNAAAVAATFTT